MATAETRVRLTVEVTDELNQRLADLARELGGSKCDVFRKAIALVEVAVNAKRHGKRIAVLDQRGRVVTTIIGL
jgi:predicted transcriptional regulator